MKPKFSLAAQGVSNTPSNAEKHRQTAINTLQRGRYHQMKHRAGTSRLLAIILHLLNVAALKPARLAAQFFWHFSRSALA
jgi:hypothetical protein